ncbi:sentrin-specific protease 7 isoform X2 [Chionomys nivalis]|uniref:sentrin-specific protease 7 isoform X2 n=1 Tax=Chionomys nivalis TaxID=269649 RepID=UPI002598203E|nr:sentrin-specific protease 7 isoform X2 [Chionomys nivalis]
MDRARPGRRRSSAEIVTEGKRKKSSSPDLQEITKLLAVKSEDVLAQSPLSKLRGSECWKLPKGWTRSLRNKVICLDHKTKKGVHGHPVTSKASPERHLRVMLTNVLWTDLGRKFRKTLPRNDANLCDTSKVQSESLPSTSVDSVETCQKLDPLHQSLNLSERRSKPSKTDNISAKKAPNVKEKHRADRGISVTSGTQPKDFNPESKECNNLEEGTRNKKTSCSYSEMEHIPVSRKRKKRVRSHLHDSHNSESSLDKSTEYVKEEENDSTASSKLEQSSESCHWDPAPPVGLTPEPSESEATSVCPLAIQEAGASAASGRACSPSRSPESSVSHNEVESSSLAEKGEELTVEEKSLVGANSEENQLLISAEPIVVSSDEEGPIEHKNSVILNLQPNQEFEIASENQGTSEVHLSELPLSACESVQASSELCPYNSDMENISCIKTNSEMDLKLDFVFTSLYIGKIKGASKGCVTFTTKYIKIPFQVSTNEVLLSVDTTHLKRFGLWKSKDDDHSGRSHAILFLWVSSKYLQEIQTQLENPMLSQQSKASEFIFLELNSSVSQKEELKLRDIMMEISKTNGESELSYPLSWVQAFPLFQDIPSKESSFVHYYCASTCSFPVAADTETRRKSLSQPSNSDVVKPTYTLLQKQSGGCYSLSITSNPDEEWREVRHTGPVQKLIVYPPPPTKGGLGVTNEDLECLEEGEFLNDVIIDFYLKYLLLEKASDELVERSHIFSSFFYKCLTRKENNLTEDNPDLSMAQRRHKRVRTWTRHINIFNKDYIFVPVNESSHWYLAVICFPWLEEAVYEDCPQTASQQSQDQQSQHDNKIIDSDLRPTSAVSASAEDSQSTEMSMSVPKKMCKRPCILILDSLKAASIQNTVQNLREYLEVEWEVKRKTHREFSKTSMVDLCPKVPKQDNSSDCGVYLLQYVESFFQDPIVNFELPIHLEKWFPRHVIKTKREDIRELILKLHLQQQKGSSS